MTWTDGGIDSHPSIILQTLILEVQVLQWCFDDWRKGIISTNINDSSPLTPKLYLNDGTLNLDL